MCALAFALITFPVPKTFCAGGRHPGITTDSAEPTAADLEVGFDPVTAPALDGSNTDTSPQTLSGTSNQEGPSLPAVDEEPAATPPRPRLNRITSEAYLALEQKASTRPFAFLNILLGLLGTLLFLAYARSRRQRRSALCSQCPSPQPCLRVLNLTARLFRSVAVPMHAKIPNVAVKNADYLAVFLLFQPPLSPQSPGAIHRARACLA